MVEISKNKYPKELTKDYNKVLNVLTECYDKLLKLSNNLGEADSCEVDETIHQLIHEIKRSQKIVLDNYNDIGERLSILYARKTVRKPVKKTVRKTIRRY